MAMTDEWTAEWTAELPSRPGFYVGYSGEKMKLFQCVQSGKKGVYLLLGGQTAKFHAWKRIITPDGE